LEVVLGLTASGLTPGGDGRLERFLLEPSPALALKAWLGPNFAFSGPDLKDRICRRLGRDIARLDELPNRQANAILHPDRFQKLEASWRGLSYLTEQATEAENVKVLVLTVSFAELGRDLRNALEFDQSQVFRKVYGEHFDMPGGEPIGVLIGDYEFTN